MNLRNISAWSIQNPVVPIILFIFLMFAGLLSFKKMDVVMQPNIEFPMVIVTIAQPGAAPSELETQVTQRVESAIRGVNGIKEISSTVREGNSQTMAQFELGMDVNATVNEVKSQIDQIRGSLPDGILEPQVMKMDTSAQPIAYFAVSATDMTLEQLSWFVDDTVSKKLLAIDGMAQVDRFGGVDREIKVILDPARMQSLGVTAGQINQVLQQINVNTGGGQTQIAGARQSVRVLGNATKAAELADLTIPLSGGRTAKLSDVATVQDGSSERKSVATVDGKESVNFAVSRTKTASDVTVFDDSMEAFAELEKENPGVKFSVRSNMVDETKAMFHSTMAALVEGAVLAILVVFLFLRDWRATAIAALAIPLSAIPTFWFLNLMDFNINMMVMLALSLVAGVLVDDAIVEIENIVRHMRMGKSAYQAAIEAADEIGLAVVATTFSIVVVFFPVAIMPGIPGQFFRNFGYTVVISVLVSLAVARMVTPMIAAYFLKSHGEASHGEGRLMDFYMKILRWTMRDEKAIATRARFTPYHSKRSYYLAALIAGIAALVAVAMSPQNVWMKAGLSLVAPPVAMVLGLILTVIVAALFSIFVSPKRNNFAGWGRYAVQRVYARWYDNRVRMVLLAIVAFFATIGMFFVVPSQWQPSDNENSVRANFELVPGTTLQQTQAISKQVEAILKDQPETDSVLVVNRIGSGFVTVNLKKEREATSDEFKRRVTPLLQAVPDARVTFQMDGMGGASSGRPISIMLSGSDPDLLYKTATTLVEEMKGVKEIVAPRIKADLRRPEIIIRPRTELAASLGVTTVSLSQAIRVATQGEIDQNSAKYSLSDRQIPIRVMLPESSRQDLSVIENIPVPTSGGGSVPLARVADISFGAGPTTVERYNQQRRVFIGADLAQDVVKSQAMDKINALPTLKNLPLGVSNTLSGEDQIQKEFMGDFLTALITGLFLVFAVMVLLYHRFVAPLVNMSSLLLAPLGGLLALFIAGQPLSMPVYIGMLMLIGIVGKNSILLIDFAIEEMQAGIPKKEAIIDAGHKRAQPIVMTTVAMVAGMVPTALSLSGDGSWRAPMGTTVIGGLIVSTILTLLIVPAAFSLADGLEKRLARRLGSKLLASGPDDRPERESRIHGGLPSADAAQPAE